MIWIALVAVLGLAAGTWFLAKTMQTRVIVLATGLAAVGGYWFLGKPAMPDEPLAARLDTLDKLAQTGGINVEDLTIDQVMAIAQKRAHEKPNDPMPHKIMGDLLVAAGRPEQAIMAYQSALRRDPDFFPALETLADLLMQMSGRVDAQTAALYRRAFEIDPSDLRVGYMAAIGDWQAGKRPEAEAQMDAIEAQTPAGDQRLAMYAALRSAFASDTQPGPDGSNLPQTPEKTPD